MGLVDSHAHLTFSELSNNVDAVLKRCAQSGVDQVITIGIDASDAGAAVSLAMRFPDRLRAGAGLHPHEADKVTDDAFEAMARIWDDPLVVALGEMGLDYHYDLADRKTQRKAFSRQLELARERDKPLVIHCREAFDDCISILVDHGYAGRRVVFHCFTGTAAEAERIAECNWRISFTGIVTFPKSTELREIAKAYPAAELMIETDSPYLSPVPIRSKRPNEPAHVAHVARFLADLRRVPYDQFVGETSATTREFFALPAP